MECPQEKDDRVSPSMTEESIVLTEHEEELQDEGVEVLRNQDNMEKNSQESDTKPRTSLQEIDLEEVAQVNGASPGSEASNKEPDTKPSTSLQENEQIDLEEVAQFSGAMPGTSTTHTETSDQEPSTSLQQIDIEEVAQGSGASPGTSTTHTPVMIEEDQSQQEEMNQGIPPDSASTSTDVISDVDSKAELKMGATCALPGCSSSIVEGPQSPNKVAGQDLEDDMTVDLLTCNICLSEIENPKSLPCLHTFCRTCLQSWAKTSPQVLTCPTCQEKCPLPPDGIESLKGNFFVTKLKDRRNLKRKLSSPEKIPCTACDSGVEANARCMDCDDFLCKKCVEVHETLRVLKTHRVIQIVDVKSGKINLFKIPKLQQEQCKKHTGQILWFYCETCATLICRDCTVVDHCRPEHTYINLEDAIQGQRQNISSLTEDCRKILNEVEDEMTTLKKYEQQLEKATKEASDVIDHAADRALTDLQGCVEAKRNDHQAHIKHISEQRTSSINDHKERLQLLSTRLKTALDMGRQVTEDGSEFEVASTFPSLKRTLQQLKEASLPSIGSEISKLSFEINEGPLFTIHELGHIKLYTKWQRKCKFGRGSDGLKTITKAWAVALTKDGNIAVANNSSTGVVSIHTQHAPHHTNIILDTAKGMGDNPSGWKSFPRGVAVACNGHFFVTDNTIFVKEYSQEGAYLTQFSAVTPSGDASHTMRITLDSVTVDGKGNLLVGPNQHKFVSIHNLAGDHIRSFSVDIEPHFIAASHVGEELVLSSHISNTVHVVDGQGKTLHVLAPENVPVWRPRGICCNKEGEVFVSNALKERGGESSAVYRFTLTGRFLGCITREVTVPYGLALSDDDQTLVVGDKKMVSIFELQ